jgi:hypothetical protein
VCGLADDFLNLAFCFLCGTLDFLFVHNLPPAT